MKKGFKVWLKAATKRSMINTAVSGVAISATSTKFGHYDVVYILITALFVFILSMLFSILGLPETNTDGKLLIDTSDPKKDIYRLELRDDVEHISKLSIVRFDVEQSSFLSQEKHNL